MKKRVTLSVLGLILMASAGLAASKKVTVVEERILVNLPPAAQKPREISSWHEAYLNEFKLLGTMLLKGADRQAAIDLAQKRGAHLVLVNFSDTLIRKFSSRVLYEATVGPGLKQPVMGKKMKESPGFYLEMYSPGRDLQEGAKRFCANTMPYGLSGKGYYVCGTMDDMKRYLELGADPGLILDKVLDHTHYIGNDADVYKVSQVLPRMRANLEMIVLALDRGADAMDAASKIAYYLNRHIQLRGLLTPDTPARPKWPPVVADPEAPSGFAFAQAFLAEAQWIIEDRMKR